MLLILNYIFIITVALRKSSKIETIDLNNLYFRSPKQINHTFHLTNLNEKEILMIIPKMSSLTQNKSLSPVLSLNYKNNNCKLITTSSFCVLQSISPALDIALSCDSLPCSISLSSHQTVPITEVKSNISLKQIQLIKIHKKDMIVTISCNDPSIQISNELIIRTNSEYLLNDKGNKLYLIFDKSLQQLIIQASSKAVKCGQMNILANPSVLKMNIEQKIILINKKTISIQGISNNDNDIEVNIDIMNPEDKQSKAQIGLYHNNSTILKSNVNQINKLKSLTLIVKKNQIKPSNTILIQIDPLNNSLIGTFQVIETNLHVIEIQQTSFFNLSQNQQIKYKIYEIQPSTNVRIKSNIILGRLSINAYNKTVNSSELVFKCENKICEFSIKAIKNDTIGSIQLFTQTVTNHDIRYLPFDDSLQLKMKQDEIKYLIIKRPNKQQTFTIYISSPNIIVYVAGQHCPQPSSKCHDYSGSQMNPIGIQTIQSIFYVTLQALETAHFTIHIQNLSSKYLELKDSVPISITFHQDTSLLLSYKIPQISTVYFNLLSTPSMFTMYVVNNKETPDQFSPYKSNSFIRIDKEDILQKQFTILVKRVGNLTNQKFTIIASNSESIVTIDKGSPYYDSFETSEKKYYLLVVGIDENKVRMSLQISPVLKFYNISLSFGPRKDYFMHNITVNSSFVSMNIDKQIQKICNQQDNQQFCEIFIQVQNHGQQQIDTTFTLVVNQSIVQLKSGIWQRYDNQISTLHNYFYFIPKNKKRNIFVQLSNIFMTYRIEYTLWNNSNRQINRQKWPFINESKGQSKQTANILAKNIQECFPSCILLITVISVHANSSAIPPQFFSRFAGSFNIMATDSIVQLQQNQRISMSLSANQSKFLQVDLTKYIKHSDNTILTFSTNKVIGQTTIVAKIAGDQYDPPTQRDYSYSLNLKNTQIKLSSILQSHPEAKQLILLVSTYNNHASFSIMYTTSTSIIKIMPMTMLVNIKLEPRASQLYQVSFWKDFRIKIIRRQGFPYVTYAQCDQTNIQDCIKNLNKNQTQIVSKVDEIKPNNFSKVMVLKFFSKNQEILFDVLAIANDMSVRLRQGQIMTDFGQVNQLNSYLILTYRTKQTKIVITVYQGHPIATLTSQYDSIILQGKAISNLITFNVLPSMYKQNVFFLFSHLNLKIIDNSTNCSYSISYSVNNTIQLLDGLVTAGSLKGKQNVTYTYHQKTSDRLVVTIAFDNSEMLKGCKISVAQIGQDTTIIEPKIETMLTHTPKPTLVFNLDQNYSSYQILFENNKQAEIRYNISINYVDIIILPLEYQHPLLLKPEQSINLIVQVQNEAFIQFQIRKCNTSDLTFSYTQNKQSFKKGIFSNQIDIQQSFQTSKVHVKASTLFLKVYSKQGVLLSIKTKLSTNGSSISNSVRPGNQGIVQYAIKQHQKSQIQFTSLICKQKCPKNIKYQYVMGARIQDVQMSITCPSSFFLISQFKPLKSIPIRSKQVESGKLLFIAPITQDMQYLGIKAILPDLEQIPYKIIEVSTVWGQLQKHTQRHFVKFTLVLLLVISMCFLCLKIQNRKKKKRYSPLPQ